MGLTGNPKTKKKPKKTTRPKTGKGKVEHKGTAVSSQKKKAKKGEDVQQPKPLFARRRKRGALGGRGLGKAQGKNEPPWKQAEGGTNQKTSGRGLRGKTKALGRWSAGE